MKSVILPFFRPEQIERFLKETEKTISQEDGETLRHWELRIVRRKKSHIAEGHTVKPVIIHFIACKGLAADVVPGRYVHAAIKAEKL